MDAFFQGIFSVFFSDQNIGQFVCVLARVSSFLVLVPIIGANYIPNLVKIFLCFLVSFVMMPMVPVIYKGNFLFDVGLEALIGTIMAIFSRFIFDGIILGAHLIGTEMGLNYANILNPQSGEQSDPIGAIYSLILTAVFLSINGHYILFATLLKSFHAVNTSFLLNSSGMTNYIIILLKETFDLALRVSLPMVATILFAHIGLGLLSRSVPQMNAFALSLSVNILLAFFVLYLVNHDIVELSVTWVDRIQENFRDVLWSK